MADDRAQFELPVETVNSLADALGFARPVRKEQAPEPETVDDTGEPDTTEDEFEDVSEAELAESVTTKRLNGHIVLSGFDSEVVGSIPPELKFRILANRSGSKVRFIIDVKA
jgi:hypothetical protein